VRGHIISDKQEETGKPASSPGQRRQRVDDEQTWRGGARAT